MNLQQLGDRDGWVCWICDNDVDPRAPVGSANAASIDHVVPRALGGTSEPDNLRLAHRKCNSTRGSKVPELRWPHTEDLIDSAPLWPALQRMQKKLGTSETVAFFTSLTSAEEASAWVVIKATQLTGIPWTSEVHPTESSYGVKLSPS